MEKSIKLFDNKKIRVEWDSGAENWYFSIVDVVAVLTDNNFQGARNYWKVLKHRLNDEGNQTVTNCNQLKMLASDGKMRLTDVADTEQLLRLIQSIPSKKAEPFKMWLARVGRERIDETDNICMVRKNTVPNRTFSRAPYGTLSAWFYLILYTKYNKYINITEFV